MRTLAPTRLAIAALSSLPTVLAMLPAHAATWSKHDDVAKYQQAQISLIHAIATARRKVLEKPGPGDRTINAWFDGATNQFHVQMVSHGSVIDAAVLPDTSETVAAKAPRPISTLPEEEQRLLAGVPPDAIDPMLAAAVADEQNGSAIDVGLVQSRNRVMYRVDLVRDGKLASLLVDPITRASIAAPP